jgi:glycosyltransferase involved in cell wall biosynthesis
MKLVIQIPAYNEAESLPRTLSKLPRTLPGVDELEWLVVDDGSTDGTAEVARANGVHHVVRFKRNRGLARAFAAGLERALAVGADVVVNTDADDQYVAADIPLLVAPILDGSADLVVGERPMTGFGAVKRALQRLGTWMVRRISGAEVRDAASGFRAISREAALSMKVFNEFSYTVETLIQAGLAGWAVKSVAIRTNEVTRPSRLFRSTTGYVIRQTATMLRILVTYRPFRFFAVPGAALFAMGFLIGVRFLFHYVTEGGQGRIQSLILAALSMGLGAGLVLVGLVTDLIAVNRKLLQSVEAQLHARDRGGTVPPVRSGPRQRKQEGSGH